MNPIAIHIRRIAQHITVPTANFLKITIKSISTDKTPSISKCILKDLIFTARKVVKIKMSSSDKIIYFTRPTLLHIPYMIDQLLVEKKV